MVDPHPRSLYTIRGAAWPPGYTPALASPRYISTEGCAPNPGKIETVVNWGKTEDESQNSKDTSKKKKFTDLISVQRFLGFANFYRRFIKNYYSGIVAPLTKLSGKEVTFEWTP